MVTNALTLMIICVFAFVPLLLGELARNRSLPTSEDFILQGRRMKILPMYATVFSTWMSAFAFIGGMAYFHEQGPIYMTTVGWDALFAILFISVGKRIWHYGRVHNYYTPTDFFDDIYDSEILNLIVTAISVVCTMIYLQVQIVGGLLAMEISTGGMISPYMGGIIFFAILVIYLWAGGLRAVAWTDAFYGILIIVTIISSGFFLMKVAGGTDYVFNALIERDPSNVALTGEEGGNRTAMWLSLFVIVPVGAFMGPQMWIRNYAAESEKNFYMLPWLLILSSIICVGTLFAGSAGVVLAEGSGDPDSAFFRLIMEYGPVFFRDFVIVGVFATIFSTANSQVHALSAVYTMDVYKRYINRNSSDRKLVSTAKWATLFISAVSYGLMVVIPGSILDLGVIAMGGMAQLFIPVMGALFWKRSTAGAAISGIVSGEAAFLISMLLGGGDSSICAIAGMFVNLFMFVTVVLVDKPRITVYKKIETYRNEYRQKGY
ncbi:MAG TPA: sodium:solute symporter family protein [Candidatus Copromorpha excrementigallinarum]|uniref:Sodium:solute symporter family protein n=1 Tax=Candidatus Allocopromorpha excrementigallinarum TaxID=2840742 RepID=A0A9D1HZQ1_9FIRM|nr:sodium:solute symporter family protein [Candidatus Copromorpha excrementigallinarum]